MAQTARACGCRGMSRSPETQRARSTWLIFRAPLVCALLTLAGLTSALIGDGLWNVASWCCLGTVVLTALRAIRQ